ncbi:MAG: DNA glycosylase [Halobacteriota archaeon]
MKLESNFNLEHTLSCGQVFRWGKANGWWYGIVDGSILKVRQEGDELHFTAYPEDVAEEFIKSYFRLDDDLSNILQIINKDVEINKAIQQFHGLRIVRQSVWDCLISYICATNASIAVIENMLQNLSEKFGDEIVVNGKAFFSFPKVKKLAKASVNEIKLCNVGYRARFLSEIAKQVESNPNLLEERRDSDYLELRDELRSLPGVGPKVADCVSLFAFDKLEAFPIDVWIRRVIYQIRGAAIPRTKDGTEKSLTVSEYTELSSFARRHYGMFAGYAQEYLFYYIRSKDR